MGFQPHLRCSSRLESVNSRGKIYVLASLEIATNMFGRPAGTPKQEIIRLDLFASLRLESEHPTHGVLGRNCLLYFAHQLRQPCSRF